MTVYDSYLSITETFLEAIDILGSARPRTLAGHYQIRFSERLKVPKILFSNTL